MYTIKYEWKTFSVSLQELATDLRTIAGEQYLGMSAGQSLEIHLKVAPSLALSAKIQQKWDSLTGATEAKKINLASNRALAEKKARDLLAIQAWDQLIPAERKMVMSLELNEQDKDALLAKYPQK